MNQIGILAYGSLIEDPGHELEPLVQQTMREVVTPFNVEFARSSRSRGCAPTLVPVNGYGNPVKAVILLLRETVDLETAKNLLWRRETRNENSKKTYANPKSPTKNQVVVELIENLHGVAKVIYTKIGSNIESPTASELARLAIKSARTEAGANGKDGISYLLSIKRQGIKTPLMESYEAEILKKLGVNNLDDALRCVRQSV